MNTLQAILPTFVILGGVIDPIGRIPVLVSATRFKSDGERKHIALVVSIAAAVILLFFLVVGEVVLRSMGVSLLAFQIADGIVLFPSALTMILGESKPGGGVIR